MATVQTRGEILDEVKQAFGLVPEWIKDIPDLALAPFWAVQRDLLMGETKIPNKYKELIGLAVSGATRCRYCALFHTEAARLHGATDDEIAEACALAGHTMFASTYLNAMQVDYEGFRKEVSEMVSYAKKQMAAQTQRSQPRSGQAAHA